MPKILKVLALDEIEGCMITCNKCQSTNILNTQAGADMGASCPTCYGQWIDNPRAYSALGAFVTALTQMRDDDAVKNRVKVELVFESE